MIHKNKMSKRVSKDEYSRRRNDDEVYAPISRDVKCRDVNDMRGVCDISDIVTDESGEIGIFRCGGLGFDVDDIET